jgi:hypothetical protein
MGWYHCVDMASFVSLRQCCCRYTTLLNVKIVIRYIMVVAC